MKKFKKVFTVLLTLAMVLGMCITSSAEESKQPTSNDSAPVTIGGIDASKTDLQVYQIIDAVYTKDGGFTGYKWVAGSKIGEKVVFSTDGVVEGLTDVEVATIAKTVGRESFTDFTNGTNLEVGTWLVIATPKKDVQITYNPMIVSVYYTVDGVVVDAVNASDNWELTTANAYKKSTEISTTKTVDEIDKNAEVGKEVHYTLSGVIPSYSNQYDTNSLVYKLTDTIINGLEYTKNGVEVTIGSNRTTVNNNNYTITYTNDNKSFTISFTPAYIKSLANTTMDSDRTVYVRYGAKVTEDAIVDVGKNTVQVEYTRKPGENSKGDTISEYTYTYSFDGVVKKVNEKEEPLSNAEFTLYYDQECTQSVGVFTTGENGNIKFDGLDGDETYYLKETKAPNGYTLNENVFSIEFSNIVANEGIISSYTIVVTNITLGQRVADVTIENGKVSGNTGMIVNTTISSLPSTGGIGTTIFTIGGCAIMIIAAALFFASRRKASK